MSFSLEIQSYDDDHPIMVATDSDMAMLLHLYNALSVPLTEGWLESVVIYRTDSNVRTPVRWTERKEDRTHTDQFTDSERMDGYGNSADRINVIPIGILRKVEH